MRCKNCKDKFEQYEFNNKFCKEIDCQVAKGMYLLEKKKAKKRKDWNKEKKERKEKLKTKSDYLKEAQTEFNKFIRLRDEGLNCISCNKPPLKKNAGHYRSVGGNPELRFNELNCHLQCEYCNTYLHANLIEYRKNLIKKIGIDMVEFLESIHQPKRYTIEEIKEIKNKYKNKCKNILQNK